MSLVEILLGSAVFFGLALFAIRPRKRRGKGSGTDGSGGFFDSDGDGGHCGGGD